MISSWFSLKNSVGARWHALDPAWRWAVGVYAGARIVYTVWSLVVALLVPAVLQNLDVFGVPVVASFEMLTGERHVYSRNVEGQVLTFRRIDSTILSDNETGSLWDLRQARATSGPFAGQSLSPATYDAESLFPYRGVAPVEGWFGLWQRFDVLWYQAIAQNGYGSVGGDIHFPPLFPLLERLLGFLLGGRYFLAGWLISQMALVGSLVLLYRIALKWQGAQTARRAVVLLVLFPTAFFFFTAYSESLFLLLSLLAFTALDQERDARAGLFVFLAILTRLQGIALIVPLGVVAVQNMLKTRRIVAGDVLMLALPLFAGAFYLLLRSLAGDANVLPTAEPQLNARLVLPWENLIYAVRWIAAGKFLVADLLNLGATLLALAILAIGARRLPLSMMLYAAATLVVVSARYVDTQPLNSMTRYQLGLFPLFMLLGYWSKQRWIERAVVYISLPLALYLTAQFLVWGWVS